MAMKIQLDDYYTDTRVRHRLSYLKELGFCVSVSALLSKSERSDLMEMSNHFHIALHGWDHFIEARLGYWGARHLFEMAISWDCFDGTFVMPWNTLPNPRFIQAMKESGFKLATPYLWQCRLLSLFGCKCEHRVLDMLLHPPDLLLRWNKTLSRIGDILDRREE